VVSWFLRNTGSRLAERRYSCTLRRFNTATISKALRLLDTSGAAFLLPTHHRETHMTGWDLLGWLIGYTSVAALALFLLDRSHTRAIAKVIEMYDQQSRVQAIIIEQLRRALDALKKAQT